MVAPEESAPAPIRALGPMPEQSAMVVEIAGRIDRADIPALCERVRLALEGSTGRFVVCDVRAVEPDCVAVDALARLQLTVMRLGRRLLLRDASPELRGLLRFVGMSEVLAPGGTSGVEPRREPE